MLEEHKLPLDSFIGGWYISPNICDSLIDVFKKNITDEQTNVMRKFNKYIKDDNRVEKFILPLGDGLTICRKI